MYQVKEIDLVYRLTNCLQTILELEPEVARLEMGSMLLREFGLLKAFLLKVETFELEEEDVARIEQATASFLSELETPLGALGDDSSAHPLQ